MKKYLFMLAAMAALPMTFSSCSSNDDNSTIIIKSSNTEFTDEAKKLDFGAGLKLNDAQLIKSIELTESGRYIVRLKETENSQDEKTRADSDDITYLTGFYHILVKGESYRLDNFGDLTLKIEGNVIYITIKLLNGNSINAEATTGDVIEAISNSQFTKNLCQYWQVNKTRLRLTNKKGLKLARDFNGCNLREIKKYIEDNSDCRIKETFETKSQLTNMTFSKYATFQLYYKDGIDTGRWYWVQESDGTLHYTWEGHEMGNSFEAGNGIVVFKNENECWLTVEAVIDTNGTDYDTTLTYMLSVVSTK